MPKAVFFGELKQAKRDHGAPRKRFKDQLKKQLSLARIQHQTWQQEARDRDKWRCSIRRSNRKFEIERSGAAKEKRKRRKEGSKNQPTAVPSFICPACNRTCSSRIGLFSHQTACRNGSHLL
ncbi:hypothetical protein ACOMHN_001307 [Nucella lapillus]